jgi:hypothetical protein
MSLVGVLAFGLLIWFLVEKSRRKTHKVSPSAA